MAPIQLLESVDLRSLLEAKRVTDGKKLWPGQTPAPRLTDEHGHLRFPALCSYNCPFELLSHRLFHSELPGGHRWWFTPPCSSPQPLTKKLPFSAVPVPPEPHFFGGSGGAVVSDYPTPHLCG